MTFIVGAIIGFCAGAMSVIAWALCRANKEEDE